MTQESTAPGIRPGVLERNEFEAALLREQFRDAGVFVVTLSSSVGAGKTVLLEATLTLLRNKFRTAALVGDEASEKDWARLASTMAPIRPLKRGRDGELDASKVHEALAGWDIDPIDFLFIENTGEWRPERCFDLGENLRITLLSVTDGHDYPLESPILFQNADVTIVTKIDLADLLEFDWPAAHSNLQRVHPGTDVCKVSVKTGEGMIEYAAYLEARLREFRSAKAV